MVQTRHHLEESFQSIQKRIQEMGARVEQALDKALTSLETNDRSLAKEVEKEDTYIDKLCLEIEESCIQLIATEQPVASDLRQVVARFQISTELERIGDHAKFLARTQKNVSETMLNPFLKKVREMVKAGIMMIHDAIRALADNDEVQALEIAHRDDEIDALHYKLYDRILTRTKEHPDKIEQGMTLLFLNRFLERVGDHIANVCEWIIYAKTGKRIELN